jgi:hypothetical protein
VIVEDIDEQTPEPKWVQQEKWLRERGLRDFTLDDIKAEYDVPPQPPAAYIGTSPTEEEDPERQLRKPPRNLSPPAKPKLYEIRGKGTYAVDAAKRAVDDWLAAVTAAGGLRSRMAPERVKRI